MRINNLNNDNLSTAFGYNLPKYCDYNRTIPTERFINEICQRKLSEGQAVYKEYVQALENFKNKRFNAETLDLFYRPQIEKLSKWEKYFYNKFILGLNSPTYQVMEKKEITYELKTPFRNLLNFIQGKPERNKKITKTVDTPVSHHDLSKIDANINGIRFTRYGSFFYGDNPPNDFYELEVASGNENFVIGRFSADEFQGYERADKRLREILSNPDELNKLGNKITEFLEKRFRLYCEGLKDDFKKRSA